MNTETYSERGGELVRLLGRKKINSFISKNPSLIFHLTGLQDIPGYILFFNDEIKFVTDRRFLIEIEGIKDFISAEISPSSIISYIKPLKKHFKEAGIEFGKVTHEEFMILSDGLECKFNDSGEIISQFLSFTDGLQLDSFVRGAEITKTLFSHCKKIFEENNSLTEKELAEELHTILVKQGAEKFSFEPIIAADENSAKPHHVPSDKNIQDCKVLLVDLGVRYSGMCTDVTRTFIRGAGKPKKIERIVQNGFKKVLSKVKAGLKVSELDLLWKEEIGKYNLTKHFTHALGHGLGYEVHQIPRISEFSKELLLENQIITLEPALYFTDEFGYRFESDILVTKESGINLTVF